MSDDEFVELVRIINVLLNYSIGVRSVKGGSFMWSREFIKNYAKDFLRKYYWKAFLVCLIASIFGTIGSNSVQWKRSDYNQKQTIIERDKITLEFKNPALRFTIRKMGMSPTFNITKKNIAMIALLSLMLSITVGNVLEVGKVKFFLRGFEDDVDIGNLTSNFNSNEYLGVVKTQFLRGFYNFLWTLLFIIPGIVKTYEYKLVPYILSQEPYLSSDEVIKKSMDMTEGHKWNMFVLDLSFLGWHLLGLLFFGIGSIFVYPYEEATYAKLYNILSGNDGMDNEIIFEQN